MRRPFQRDAVAVAVEALSWMDLEGISERQAFTRAARQLAVTDGRALRMALLLIMETTRRLNLIDNMLVTAVSHSTFDELDLGQRNLLRSFTYWIKIRRQPEEAIPYLKAARQAMGWRQLHPLEMHFGKILAKTQDATRLVEEERTRFETFNQTWFVKYCIRTFGRCLALRYLRSTIERPSTYVRVNTLVNPPIKCRSTMESEGILLEPIEPLRNVFRVLSSRQPIIKTESYRSGLFHIQDKSSSLSIQVADIEPGENVLDMCAAPGGKTSHIAAQMENSGTIVSLDYSLRRMRTWKETTRRLRVKCAIPLVADGLRALPLSRKLDAVILDPPCTSTGAFGRMPSAKWRMTPTTIERAAEIQSRLLENAATHVREGGRLIYSTCSVTVEENELVIRNFLRGHPEYHLVKQELFIGSKGLMGLELCQRLFQHNDDCNGYFIAKLRRSGENQCCAVE